MLDLYLPRSGVVFHLNQRILQLQKRSEVRLGQSRGLCRGFHKLEAGDKIFVETKGDKRMIRVGMKGGL